MKQKPLSKASDFCQVGDVFTLTKLEASERKYNGCWAIPSVGFANALALNDFTVEVAVHDNTLIVHSENLNKIDSPEAHDQLPLFKERMQAVTELWNIGSWCIYSVEVFGTANLLDSCRSRVAAMVGGVLWH